MRFDDTKEEEEDLKVVLTKWQSDYYTLYNSCSMTDNNFKLYVSDVLYIYIIMIYVLLTTKMFFLMSPLQWKKYNMPYKN